MKIFCRACLMNMLFQPTTFGKRVVFEVAAEAARFRSLRSIRHLLLRLS